LFKVFAVLCFLAVLAVGVVVFLFWKGLTR